MLKFLTDSWELAAAVGMLVFAWAVPWLLGRALRRRMAAARKAGRKTRALEMVVAAGPLLRWGMVLGAGALAVAHFSMPERVEKWMVFGLQSIFTLLCAWVAARIVGAALDGWARHAADPDTMQSRATLAPLLANGVKVGFLLLAFLLILQNGGYNVAGLIAGLGIGGVAVALAAKDTLANLFGSLSLLMDRPFAVGDFVRFDVYEGTVERIGLRSTRLRTPDGLVVAVPNERIASAPVTNVSQRETRRMVMNLGLVYDLTTEQMRNALAIVRSVFQSHEQTEDAWVFFNEFGQSALNIQVTYWCKQVTPREFLQAVEEINLEIKARFEEAGIAMAFPTRTVLLKQQAAASDK